MNARALLCAGALVTTACAGSHRAAPAGSAPAPEPLKLEPLADLVPAAGVAWLIELRPVEILADPTLAAAVALVLPAERFEAFARGHGGIDLRQAAEITLAGFPDATLSLARLALDPPRVEQAFTLRAAAVDGRAIEHGVTRLWGTVGDERQQIAIFGHQAVGLEEGQLGPLRVAAYYAEGRLKRSPPALQAEPLRTAAERLGLAPARGFAPGPFEGTWANGLGGLLRGATAVAAALRPAPTATGQQAVELDVVVLGAWGDDGPAAAERLGAAFNVLAEDAIGRLTGLNHPLEGPHVVGNATEVRLKVILDPTMLARGVRDATSAGVTDIVASPRRARPDPGPALTPDPPKW